MGFESLHERNFITKNRVAVPGRTVEFLANDKRLPEHQLKNGELPQFSQEMYLVGGDYPDPGPLWSPSEITTEIWLDANDASTIVATAGAVSEWIDKSQSPYEITQVSAGARPTTGIRTLNGKNIIDFDGLTQYLDITSPGPQQDGDAIMLGVIDFDGNTQRQRAFTFQDIIATRWSMEFTLGNNFEYNQDDSSFAGPNLDFTPTTGAKLFGGYRSGSDNYVTVDGVLGGPEPGAISGPLTEWRIGARRINISPFIVDYLDAGVAELIIVKEYSLELLQKLEGYMAWKWGIQANLPSDHPYKNSPPRL